MYDNIVIISGEQTLKQYMAKQEKYPFTSYHEHTFTCIVGFISQDALPNQHDTFYVSKKSISAMEHLKSILLEEYEQRPDTVGLILHQCIDDIRRKRMFWKSYLKVMVQFSDMWMWYV